MPGPGVVDDTLVDGTRDQGVEFTLEAASAGTPETVEDVGGVGRVEPARLAGLGQGKGQDREASGTVGQAGGSGVEADQLEIQAQSPRPVRQQPGVGDGDQLRGETPGVRASLGRSGLAKP